MAKGSSFEREFCKDLSRWWDCDRDGRDDIFWRSSNSGGRATVRAALGKTTAGQYGDVAATCPSGVPLMDFVTIELKRGYSKFTIQDPFDVKTAGAQQQWTKWYEQAVRSHLDAGSCGWLLVHQRDRRDPLVYMPEQLYAKMVKSLSFQTEPAPIMRFTFCDRYFLGQEPCCVMMRWEDWKTGTSQLKIRSTLTDWEGR